MESFAILFQFLRQSRNIISSSSFGIVSKTVFQCEDLES